MVEASCVPQTVDMWYFICLIFTWKENTKGHELTREGYHAGFDTYKEMVRDMKVRVSLIFSNRGL